LATRFGITGWAGGEATQAAQTCFLAWLNERGHVGDSDIEKGIEQVIAYIEKYGDSRFQHLRPGEGDFVQSYNTVRMGYRLFQSPPLPSSNRSYIEAAMDESTAEATPPAWFYYVLPEAWKEMTKGYNPTAIAKAMVARGMMLKKEKTQLTAAQCASRQHGYARMSVSILVVDDEPDVADLFRQRFRREARDGTYVMHFAQSGEGAIQQLTEGIEPTLIVILSDINMPGMDGLQLLDQIKQRFPDMPVMMVTAYGDDERRRRASELGAFEFLTKPVDFELLKTQLRQLPTAAA
jgi:CheY-like chemotaxis protein